MGMEPQRRLRLLIEKRWLYISRCHLHDTEKEVIPVSDERHLSHWQIRVMVCRRSRINPTEKLKRKRKKKKKQVERVASVAAAASNNEAD